MIYDCDCSNLFTVIFQKTISKYHFKTALTVIVFNHRLGTGTCSLNVSWQKLGERSLLSGHLNTFTRKWFAISQKNDGFVPKRCVISVIYKPHAVPDHKENRAFSTGCFQVNGFLSVFYSETFFFFKLKRENIPSQNLLSFVVIIVIENVSTRGKS